MLSVCIDSITERFASRFKHQLRILSPGEHQTAVLQLLIDHVIMVFTGNPERAIDTRRPERFTGRKTDEPSRGLHIAAQHKKRSEPLRI